MSNRDIDLMLTNRGFARYFCIVIIILSVGPIPANIVYRLYDITSKVPTKITHWSCSNEVNVPITVIVLLKCYWKHPQHFCRQKQRHICKTQDLKFTTSGNNYEDHLYKYWLVNSNMIQGHIWTLLCVTHNYATGWHLNLSVWHDTNSLVCNSMIPIQTLHFFMIAYYYHKRYHIIVNSRGRVLDNDQAWLLGQLYIGRSNQNLPKFWTEMQNFYDVFFNLKKTYSDLFTSKCCH